jgi:hypothetical protein
MSNERIERIRAEDARVGDRIKAPEGRVFYELTVAEHEPSLEEDNEFSVRLGTGWGSVTLEPGEIVERENWQTGDAAAEIDEHMHSRLDDLALLVGTAEGKGEGWAHPARLEALGIEDKHAHPEIGTAEEEAQERLDEYPLAVEATVTFEVVLGTGGPDDRLLFECSGTPSPVQPDPHTPPPTVYEINRVLYRYSWTGSAERVLTGEDRETAEALARRVVPELAE